MKISKKEYGLLSQLEEPDVLSALEKAVKMRMALRVIYTWASVDGALDPANVRILVGSAIKIKRND